MPNLTKIVNLVGEIYKTSGFKEPRRPGKKEFTDLYICQLVVVQNLKGFTNESAFLRFLKNHPCKAFPNLPTQSCYNHRSKTLGPVIEQLTATVLKKLRVNKTKIRIIDATGVPVTKFYRRWKTKAFSNNKFFGVGYCHAKKERYYGVKLTLIVSKQGIPVTYYLMSARCHDVKALRPAVKNLTGVWLIGDKGYAGKKIHQALKLEQRIKVIIPKRKNQKVRNTKWEKRKLKHRRLIEVINEQLKDHFNLEKLRAKSLEGIKTRIRNIIFSYLMAIHFNKKYHRNLLSIKGILS
jgi:hypothetical protein